MMRPVILAFILSFTFLSTFAYDFSALNEDGQTIFYNISGKDAQVTFCKQFVPTDSYSSHLKVPASVTSEGITYRVTSIGRHAFYGSRIESIDLPESLTSIDDFAFAGCNLLTSIDLPAAISSLGKNVFDGCFSLSSIDVDGKNAYYRSVSGAVYNKAGTALLIYPQGRENEAVINPNTSEICNHAFFGCPFISHISIPESVKSIGDNSFYFCNSITSIHIPASVTSIGRAAFSNCCNLLSINVDNNNPSFTSVDGSLLDNAAKTLIASPAARIGSSSIPESVTSISDLSFFSNIGLTTAIIPEGTIDIGEAAFLDCQSLSAISLPLSIRNIGPLAFAMCSSLESVYIKNPLPSEINVSPDAFSGFDTGKCTLYVPRGAAAAYSSAEPWNDFKIITEYDVLTPQQIVWTTDYNLDSHDSITIILDAEASSGLPVSYRLAPESIPLASISGNKLTMQPNTKITVTATQNGNHQYAPADALTRTIEMVDAIDTPLADSDLRVTSSPGKIIILGASKDALVNVFDIAGHLVYSGTDHIIAVASLQIYIVNIGKQTFKIPVK